MRGVSVVLFFAMIIAALFAFSGAWNPYPVYNTQVAIAPYQFANFLFWMFLLLFFAAVLFSAPERRRPLPPLAHTIRERKLRAQESTITGGFTLALFLLIIAVISGLFGFGIVASTVAGLAMIVFWIAIVVGIVAVAMGFCDHRTHSH